MHKDEIADLIALRNDDLITWLKSHDNERWEMGPTDKWTTGQQTLHLLKSIKPLNTALSLPRFIIRNRFGRTNRDIRNYDDVVSRYKQRLKDSNPKGKTPYNNLKVPIVKDKQYLLNRIQVEHKKLEYKTRKISDKNLDQLVLPHPLMGKMPVRELLMWTAYHIEHHTNQLKANY